MGNAKIEIRLGDLEFIGDGEQDWIEIQLDKILSKASDLASINSNINNLEDSKQDKSHLPMGPDSNIAQKPLATFLREKNATNNQTKKFLATAVWLEAKGANRINTNEVTKALKDNNQTKLTNPSRCLGDNIGKGFCEKDGRQFFVTDEGKNSL